MRHLNMMGFAVIVVLTLVAFAGATTVSATRLCSTNTSPCANVYSNDTTFTTHLKTGTAAVLTTAGGVINPTISCNLSTFGVTNSNQGGGAGVSVAVRLTSLILTTCASANPSGCSSSATVDSLTSATGTIAWTAGANGTLRLTPPLLGFLCPTALGSVLCTFGGTGTLDATSNGGSPAVVSFTNQALAAMGGFGCPMSSTFNAQYQTTVPLWIESF